MQNTPIKINSSSASEPEWILNRSQMSMKVNFPTAPSPVKTQLLMWAPVAWDLRSSRHWDALWILLSYLESSHATVHPTSWSYCFFYESSSTELTPDLWAKHRNNSYREELWHHILFHVPTQGWITSFSSYTMGYKGGLWTTNIESQNNLGWKGSNKMI